MLMIQSSKHFQTLYDFLETVDAMTPAELKALSREAHAIRDEMGHAKSRQRLWDLTGKYLEKVGKDG